MSGQVGVFAAGAVLLVAMAMLFPLRGGAGEHAHAGPGTVTVDRLRASLTARAVAVAPIDAVPDEEIIWPSHDEPEHVGRHRLRTDEWFCHRLATMLALHAHCEQRPVVASDPPPRADIRLHRALI